MARTTARTWPIFRLRKIWFRFTSEYCTGDKSVIINYTATIAINNTTFPSADTRSFPSLRE